MCFYADSSDPMEREDNNARIRGDILEGDIRENGI